MKRLIAILATASLIITLSVPAVAVDNYRIKVDSNNLRDIYVSEDEILAIKTPATEYDALYTQVMEDLIDISGAYIEPNLCKPISISQNGLIRYNITYPDGIVNEIETERNADGLIVLHFYEDEIHNEIIILENGNLLVDGQLVDIQNNNMMTQTGGVTMDNTVQPRMRNHEYSMTPWGNAADYTIYCGTWSGNQCSWGVSTLVGLATGTVATIICSKVNAKLGLSIGASIFSSVASAMITRCEIYGMEDAYFSWEFRTYESEDSMSIDRLYQYTGACYSRRNLEGAEFAHTYYYRNWFS